jgi:hypothetical protein
VLPSSKLNNIKKKTGRMELRINASAGLFSREAVIEKAKVAEAYWGNIAEQYGTSGNVYYNKQYRCQQLAIMAENAAGDQVVLTAEDAELVFDNKYK